MKWVRSKYFTLVLYALFFYGSWTIFRLVIDPHIGSELIKTALIKNIIWTLPAWLMIRDHQSWLSVSLKEMFITKVRWRRYAWLFGLLLVYGLVVAFAEHGSLNLFRYFTFNDAVVVLFVGITEELVFRGWLLNATMTKTKRWVPVAVNAVMFQAIHFPLWIQQGIFVHQFTSLTFVFNLIFSIIMAVAFLRSRSLLVPISLHMFWDLVDFALGI